MKRRKPGVPALYLFLSLSLLAGCGSRNAEEVIGGDSDTEEIGGDWRSTGLYSNMDELNDNTCIYFLDQDDGYAIYLGGADDDSEPAYLCDLPVLEEETGFGVDDIKYNYTEDRDGDGNAEIALVADSRHVLWYQLDLDSESVHFLEVTQRDVAVKIPQENGEAAADDRITEDTVISGSEDSDDASARYIGCWKYTEYENWLVFLDDETYEWYYSDGHYDVGYWDMWGDEMLTINIQGLYYIDYIPEDDGTLTDSEGDSLFRTNLPEF